jgi:uracil-DNA glycosylase
MIRKEVLGELGLLPLYHRRQPAAPLPGAAAAAEAGLPEADLPEADRAAAHPAGGLAGLDWPALMAAIDSCEVCAAYAPQMPAVPGYGAVPADCLVIGFAPAASGVPYAGQAGKLLENMLAAIGVQSARQAYITTLFKRASGRADAGWLAHSIAYLQRQLQLLAPRALLVLGEQPAQYLLDSSAPLAQLRGQSHQYLGVPLVVTHDPADLLRHAAEKAAAWSDLCRLRQLLAMA